jgi:hypothetical protein
MRVPRGSREGVKEGEAVSDSWPKAIKGAEIEKLESNAKAATCKGRRIDKQSSIEVLYRTSPSYALTIKFRNN